MGLIIWTLAAVAAAGLAKSGEVDENDVSTTVAQLSTDAITVGAEQLLKVHAKSKNKSYNLKAA